MAKPGALQGATAGEVRGSKAPMQRLQGVATANRASLGDVPSAVRSPTEWGQAPSGEGGAPPSHGSGSPADEGARSRETGGAPEEPAAGQSSPDERYREGLDGPAADERPGLPVGVYHSVREAEQPLSLEIHDDGTWEVGYQGCDIPAYARGQMIATGEGWELVPSMGCTAFWVGASRFLMPERLHLRRLDDVLMLSAHGEDEFEASLGAGGRCARCGTMGPEDVYPCDDPIRGSECF